jgi:hypothetical protein
MLTNAKIYKKGGLLIQGREKSLFLKPGALEKPSAQRKKR